MSGTIPIVLVYVLLCSFLQYMVTMEKYGDRNGYRAKRVENGQEAVRHSAPWMGFQLINNVFECGTYLIDRLLNVTQGNEYSSSDIVLTAAHCVYVNKTSRLWNASQMAVVFGKHKKYVTERNDFRVEVQQIIAHPDYIKSVNERLVKDSSNDIAILRLKHSVPYDGYFTKPAVLSHSHSESYRDCYMSGWGINNLIQEQAALQTIRFSEVKFNSRLKLLESPTKEQWVTRGDSGSPLVCRHNNQSVVIAVTCCGDKNISQFVSIRRHMEWIAETINKTEKAAVYQSDLAQYDYKPSDNEVEGGVIENHLKYLYDGIANTRTSDLNNDITNTSIIDYRFEKAAVKVLKKQPGFCLEDIRDSSSVANDTECMILCYKDNYHGCCNYLRSGNRCYFAKARKNPFVLMDIETSVVISFKNGETKLQPEIPSGLQHRQYQPSESRVKKWFQHYEVAIHGTKWTDFHCLAMLQSSGGESYDRINVSSNCLKQLWNKTSTVQAFGIVTVLDGHSIYTKIGIEKFTWSSYFATAYLEKPISRSENASSVIGHSVNEKSSHPIRRTYWPFSGSFVSDASTMPWIVRFYQRTSTPIDEYICTGVLINRINFAPNSTWIDERVLTSLIFVLASTSCSGKYDINKPHDFYAVVGSQFHRIQGVNPNVTVGRVWFVGGQPEKGFTLIVILSAFNESIQPIQRPSSDFSNYSTYFIAAPSPDVLPDITWTFDPITEIPVSIDSNGAAGDNQFNVRKIHKKSGNLSDRSNGDPIIACQIDSNTENCAIVGFFWCEGPMESYEQHHSVFLHPHLETIRKILDNLRFTDELDHVYENFLE